MKILFAGTPEIAVPSLELLNKSHDIVGVLTNPDRLQGRGKKTSESPVKLKARELELPLFQPEKLDQDFRNQVKQLQPDLLVAVAYGKIFSPRFLDLFPGGGVNLHPSLLPRYRGPSPINAAILNGDGETGVTIQRLAREMDAGDILAQQTYTMRGEETTGELTRYFGEAGAILLADVLDRMEHDRLNPVAQDSREVSFCRLIDKEAGRIEWMDSASVIERKIRAYDPWPGAYTFFEGKKLNILKARVFEDDWESEQPKAPGEVVAMKKKTGILIQTGEGLLAVQTLQLQSKKALDFLSFCNGTRNFIGARLGGDE